MSASYDQSVLSETARAWVAAASPVQIAWALELGSRTADTVIDAIGAKIAVHRAPISTAKGQIGEEQVASILRRRFTVKNVSRDPKSGDMSLTIDGHHIMVEVKNYATSVPTLQVEKFQRDLSTTPVSAGLFVSLASPIAGITRDFVIRHENTGTKVIPCAYIVAPNDGQLISAISMLIWFASATDQIAAGMSRDAICDQICGLEEVVKMSSSSREIYQAALMQFIAQVQRASSGFASAETALRRTIDVVRNEVVRPHMTCVRADVIERISTNISNYARQTEEIRDLIARVIGAIPFDDDFATNIGMTKTKCTLGRVSIEFAVRTVRVSFPRAIASVEEYAALLEEFPADVEIGTAITMTLAANTCTDICKYMARV